IGSQVRRWWPTGGRVAQLEARMDEFADRVARDGTNAAREGTSARQPSRWCPYLLMRTPETVLHFKRNPLIPLRSKKHSFAANLLTCSKLIQLHRLFALGRQIERLGQHQAVVRLGRGGCLRRQAKRDPVEPGLGFVPHRSPQFA